jgi:chorismate-pyruvate lyase
LVSLFALFPPAGAIERLELITPENVPEPYHRLLVHEQHMTVTVEAHHGDRVNVQVLDAHEAGDVYARRILLRLQATGRVVQFGLMRIHLNHCGPPVRQEILSRRTPLGRILIEHGVLRRIEPSAYLRVDPGPRMIEWFGSAQPTYGRLAIIHCNGEPAVELLEIVAP